MGAGFRSSLPPWQTRLYSAKPAQADGAALPGFPQDFTTLRLWLLTGKDHDIQSDQTR